MSKQWTKTLFAGIILAVVCGCSANDRGALSGTVTLGGVPLDNGTIQFVPENISEGAPSGAVVKDGRYEVSREPGMESGTYIVNIHAFKEIPMPSGSLLSGEAVLPKMPKPEDRIPASWNEAKNSITVKPGKNVCDFNIPAE